MSSQPEIRLVPCSDQRYALASSLAARMGVPRAIILGAALDYGLQLLANGQYVVSDGKKLYSLDGPAMEITTADRKHCPRLGQPAEAA